MDNFISQGHWFYVAVMLIGALYFYIQSREPKGVPKYEYMIAIFIPVWSAIAYFSIAAGQGFLEVSERTVYFARYLDWVFTTPLLLVALAFTAMYYTKKNISIILSLVFLDVIMILTGLIASLSESPLNYAWYSIGTVALLIIFYIVWVPLKNIAKKSDEKLYHHYRNVALYLTLFWIGYPTAWLLGPSGLGIVSQSIDVTAFILLPIFSKVGFSIFDLKGLRDLEPQTIRQNKN
ncbi:bacteriorhodopsin [Alkalibacterium sp. 20]|uniref:bacteriorhodopsin n=1 Tax=Alkalibacterium sp. 20 TaxID=1798803 RepID=UPI0009001EAE|nr:bacteriorhodopsin [Alkalibacterium sp. 20]